MSDIKQLPSFEDAALLFLRTKCQTNPSYAHGYWAGLICGGQSVSPKDWIIALYEAPDAWNDLDSLLARFFLAVAEVTVEQLSDPHYIFQLLLPDDEDPMDERIASLSDWTRAFLIGFEAQGKIQPRPMLSAESKEALDDLQEITTLSTTFNETETEEQDYAEVVEYVRLAVLLLHQEMLNARSQGGVHPPYLH
jgi:yecA family protein